MPAGYSETPLPKKLGIREHDRLALFGAPPDFERTLGTLPAGVLRARRGVFDVGILFASRRAGLERALPRARARLDPNGGLWLAWPKQASGVATDLTDGVVRAAGLAAGLVDVKVCAIDGTWSGLRFVYRLRDRP